MKGRAEEHLPGGKLIRIKVEHREFIEKVEITGNIEIDPPKAIYEIENCLLNVEVISSVEGITNLIEDALKEHHASIHGATAFDIARIVKKATGN
jgi:hypothetical protein